MEQGENQSLSVSFHVGEVPASYKLDYEPCLFNSKAHRLLQAADGWKEFHLLQSEKKKVLISIYFHIYDGTAKSPFRAPFGGFECSKVATPELLFDFIGNVEQALRKNGIREIEILSPPELYSESIVTISLLSQSFQILRDEPGACIIVDAISLQEKMSKDKRVRLRQCVKAGLEFKKINLDRLEEVYDFISNCRVKQNRELSMTFMDLSKTVDAFPKSFFLVGVFEEKKMIGACICIRVNSSAVYTFYSAHNPEYDSISPRVFLLANLYGWCQKNKVTLLDLGTSALDGKPNFPLLDFKLRVGAVLTPKYKFRKELV